MSLFMNGIALGDLLTLSSVSGSIARSEKFACKMSYTDDIKKWLKRREDMFLRRLMGMLGKMAKADGKIDAWETHAAEGAFARFPRAAARRKFCVRVFNESKRARLSLYRQAWEFSHKWASPEDCLAVYELLWDVSCATGVLKPIHKDNLRGVCKYLNLPDSYFSIYFRKRSGTFREWTSGEQAQHDEFRRATQGQGSERSRRRSPPPPPRPKTALQRAYDVIGCSSTDDDAAVRRAYRLAAKKCHPDVLRAAGASEGRIAVATEQMARINDAWDTICKARGM